MIQTPSQKFRFFGILFFSGIFLSQYAVLPKFSGIFFGLLGLCFWLWKWGKVSAIFPGIFLCSGLFWGHFLPQFFPPPVDISAHIGQSIQVRGFIDSYPEYSEKNIRVYAQIQEFSLPQKIPEKSQEKANKISQAPQRLVDISLSREQSDSGSLIRKSQEKILLILPKSFSGIRYGDTFSAEITPLLPTSINRSEFDYREYLFRKGVRVLAKNPRNFLIHENVSGWKILRASQNLRNFFRRNISRHLPSVHTDIAMGMTFGSKSKLPETVQTWFSDSGLQHILVVSGTNVTLVFFLIFFLGFSLGKRMIFVITVPVLIFFVLMAGADPPVVRAAIMGFLVLCAGVIGRMADLRNFLVLALIIIGVFRPTMLQSNVSFFLSFMMMAGLICLTPVVFLEGKRVLDFVRLKIPEKWILFFVVALTAQMVVFPVITYFFGTFPIGGILANVLVDPLIPFIMGLSFVCGIFSGIPLLGKFLGFFLELGIDFVLGIAKVFAEMGNVNVSPLVSLGGIVFFLGFFVWAMVSQKYEERYWIPFLKETMRLKNS